MPLLILGLLSYAIWAAGALARAGRGLKTALSILLVLTVEANQSGIDKSLATMPVNGIDNNAISERPAASERPPTH